MTREEKAKLERDFKKYAAIQELLNNWEQIREHARYTEPEYRDDKLTEADLCALMSDKPEQMPKSERLEWSKKVSSVLVRHVEEMIARWEASCGGNRNSRLKRNIIKRFYFEYGNSLAAIAAEEGRPKDFVEKMHIMALKELSALIFGVDGLLKVGGAMYMLRIDTFRPLWREAQSPPED
ncbi:hypothetical protein FACS189425_05880 [Clostridia bacterium]|nr:hypothetical protein FACS189425_05880 [Clostridia bacterium]